MRTNDSVVKYKIEFNRTTEDGTNTFFRVFTPLSVKLVEDAEGGDAMAQDEIMEAFTRRLRRSKPDAPVPDEIVWSDFRHPVQPSTEEQP